MLQASNQLYDDSMQLIDVIIIFIYHTRTEHNLQKLNSVHKSMESYQRSYSSLNWPPTLIKQNYTVSQKKQDTELLAITSNYCPIFKIFFHQPTRQKICNKFMF